MGNIKKPDSGEKKIQHISDLIGDYGKFQQLNSLILCPLWAVTPFLVVSLPFYAPPVEQYCADDLTAPNQVRTRMTTIGFPIED